MSTIKELPTVNFDSYPGYDEFKFLHTTYSEEFKSRSLITTDWGIVDTGYDPATAPFTAGRPLLVTVSPVNPLTIDIAEGYAITPSHLLIHINAIVPSVPLPSLTAGKTYIVAVEYTLVASPQQRINRFGDLTDVRLERPSNIPVGGGESTLLSAITVADINDYNNPAIFSDDRKQNIVVIAIVNAQSDPTTSQVYLSVDLTKNSYDFNRPWFSVRDVEHRSKIGNGVVTENNPHGMDLQDLSSAGLTLYQQLKSRGGILAKDISYHGYAGKICTEEIALSRWEADMQGTVTTRQGEPPVGGRYFVRLTKLPVRTGSLYKAGKPWEPIPYTWIEGTRIVVLGTLENPSTFTGSLVFEYFTVDALEVNAESPTQGLQTIQVKPPIDAQEFIISDGLAVSELAQDSLFLPSLLGPIKRGYQVACDGRGILILNPQPMLTNIKVADLVGTTKTVNQATLNGAAVYLTLGLTRAIEHTLDLKIQIIGVDANGISKVEVLTFKGSQWKDQTTANVEEPLQFLRTANKYQLVNSISLANTLSEPHNAGPDATIGLWADIFSGTENQEFSPVVSLFWTGTTGINIKDERNIATTFDKLDQKKNRFPNELPDTNLSSIQELFSIILYPPLTNPATPSRRLMLELDDDRMWSETWKEFSTSWASGSILMSNISLVTIGQTIRIAHQKYLKIVASGANPAIGEVDYDTSPDIFRNNIIVTINDPVWDSTWWASLGTGTNPPIMLSREHAYPEGFVLNMRQKITFSSPFGIGHSFQLDINGITIGPVNYAGNNDATITAIANEITDAADLTGGVTAEVIIPTVGSYNTILLNGAPDGQIFTVKNLITGGGGPSGSLIDPLAAFTLTQPAGGILPTPHLPQRYPTALKPWVYLSRPFLWEGVRLEASISFQGDVTSFIGNLDAVEIAPSKIIYARVGSGATADPTIGQFLVDDDPDPAIALANTLANLAATVNHPLFASGVYAEVVGNAVILRSAGMASTRLKLLSAVVSSTWELTNIDGVTQYVPVGSGRSHAFLKSLRPLASAEWRFVTVEDRSEGWSPWMPMGLISPTAFTMAAPLSKSLYQIQIKLSSPEINAFSLYDYVPETSGASLAAIDVRVTDLETVISDATGISGSLDARISGVVEPDGTRIQDPELLNTHESVIQPDTSTLKERLDVIDTRLYYASGGGVTPHGAVTNLTNGIIPQLITGKKDTNGNSDFLSSASSILTIWGSSSYPLIAQINGYTYKYTRQISLDFTGEATDYYYLYLEQSTPYGKEIVNGSTMVVAGDMRLTDGAANFAEVQEGHLLYIGGILLGDEPLVMPIKTVSTNTLTFEGRIPESLNPASYSIYNPKEGTIWYTNSKTVNNNRLYLGEVNWIGSPTDAIDSYVAYRYLNKFTSAKKAVDATGGSYTVTFEHNLGFIPSSFVLYYCENTTDTEMKVLNIGDEAVVKVTKNTLTVRNRYAQLVARAFDGTTKSTGFLQLVI